MSPRLAPLEKSFSFTFVYALGMFSCHSQYSLGNIFVKIRSWATKLLGFNPNSWITVLIFKPGDSDYFSSFDSHSFGVPGKNRTSI